MAGINRNLKAGHILFRAGDPSDGMYLVRRGALTVFLEAGTKEVTLTTVETGGMVGEMALFDQKPRSASVKAARESEVTHISNAEFETLMKQIPKWFVTLMASLSARLRQTNDKLQALEGSGKSTAGDPAAKIRHLSRILNLMILVVAKDAVKEGKEWTLSQSLLEETLVQRLGEPSDRVAKVLELLMREKLLSPTKAGSLAIGNRAALTQLSDALIKHLTNFPALGCFSDEQRSILHVLEKVAGGSPYETITISLADLEKEALRMGKKPDRWAEAAQVFRQTGDDVKLVTTSGGPGLRVSRRELSAFARFHTFLAGVQLAAIP